MSEAWVDEINRLRAAKRDVVVEANVAMRDGAPPAKLRELADALDEEAGSHPWCQWLNAADARRRLARECRERAAQLEAVP